MFGGKEFDFARSLSGLIIRAGGDVRTVESVMIAVH